MRTCFVLSFASFLALALAGCGSFDAVAACESRCEERKSLGCEPSSTDCDNVCVLADDFYEDGLERAQDEGCVGEYDAYIGCIVNTPACAEQSVIDEMCLEDAVILNNCWM